MDIAITRQMHLGTVIVANMEICQSLIGLIDRVSVFNSPYPNSSRNFKKIHTILLLVCSASWQVLSNYIELHLQR